MQTVLTTISHQNIHTDKSYEAHLTIREFIHVVTLGLAIWLFNHSYVGIDIHDAKLYAVLAAHWLEKAAYARDPFFMFGSQDDFSLFSPIYGLLAHWLGLNIAAQMIVLVGAILMVSAITLIATRLFASRWAIVLTVMLCAAASYAYSPGNPLSFRINEEFATARSLAMPLGLLAIAFCMRFGFRTGIATALLATLLHPLIGVWSLLGILCFKLRDQTVILLIALGIFGIVSLILLGVPAFQPLDTEWDRLLRPLSVVYVATWPNIQLGNFLFWTSLLLLAGSYAPTNIRRWYQSIALLGAIGLLTAQFASYFYPVKLLLQIQPWRAMWLAIFFALIAAVSLLDSSVKKGKTAVLRLTIGALVIYLAHNFAGYLLLTYWLIMQTSTCQGLAEKISSNHLACDRNLTALLVTLIAIALPSYLLDIEQLANGLPLNLAVMPSFATGAFLAGGLSLGFLFISVVIAPRLERKWLTLPLLVFLLGAMLNWDQRLLATRAWESSLLKNTTQDDIAQYIHRGDVVYWHENAPMRTWFELGTASYASGIQPAGSIFSREKTFELKRRLERVVLASKLDDLLTGTSYESRTPYADQAQPKLHVPGNIFMAQGTVAPTGPGITYLCQDTMLDWVVSSQRYTKGQLTPIRAIDRVSGNPLFLYHCPYRSVS